MGDRKITNTKTQAENEPMLTLATTGFPGGIERQEAAGQNELVNSASLPTEGSEHAAWAKFGVTFGEADPADPIFRPAKLPAGWRKVATDHAMHSTLVDEKARPRASIFYKAAFYDRSAHMALLRRFEVRRVYGKGPDAPMQAEVLDAGKAAFATEPEPMARATTREEWAKEEAAEKAHIAKCTAWLAEHGYPNWSDVTAYWG